MIFYANVLCEIVHTNQGRAYHQIFFYFNILLHGIRDGFVFSFRKKKKKLRK